MSWGGRNRGKKEREGKEPEIEMSCQPKVLEETAILNRLQRKDSLIRWHLSKDLREIQVGYHAQDRGKKIPGREISKCKGPEVDACLTFFLK